jgi:ATP-dependent Clp protease ATP-binding subunit ClpA
MDAGELSSAAPSAHGRPVDCRRAVFFFTSNIDMAGFAPLLEGDGRQSGPVDALCRRHLAASGIRPELVGRIGAFLVFHPLSPRARAEIATSAIARVAAEYGLTVVRVAPEVVSAIVNRPYDDLGARPDEYYIDDLLSAEFSRYASSGEQAAVSIEASPDPVCVAATG